MNCKVEPGKVKPQEPIENAPRVCPPEIPSSHEDQPRAEKRLQDPIFFQN